MRVCHLLGLLLWRGGLLLAGGYALFLGARYALRLGRLFGVVPPLAVEVGVALFLGGMGLLFVSLVLERFADIRKERQGEP